MLCGRPPHYQKNRKAMLKDIVEKQVEMKQYFSAESASLLKGLLTRNPAKRLGCSQTDAEDIMSHPFFKDINWEDLRNKRIPAPFKPYVNGPEDTRNIDKLFTNEAVKETMDPNISETMK